MSVGATRVRRGRACGSAWRPALLPRGVAQTASLLAALLVCGGADAQSKPAGGAPPKTSVVPGVDDLPSVPNRPEPLAEEKAQAQALFDRARELHDGGKYDEACPLFAESQRLDAGLGTLLYLSDCYELTGRLASAWAGFREAAAIARLREQPAREKIARERAAALEPRLSMMRINVAEQNLAIGLALTRNGVRIGEPVWGDWVPVDPGEQRIEAVAEGYRPWSTTVPIASEAGREDVFVPPLVRAEAPPPSGDEGQSPGDVMRLAGLVVAGVGVVGIGLGAAFGVDAMSSYADARDTCVGDDASRCTAEGVALQQSASDSALVSTIAFSVGATALVGGALLYLFAPSDEPPPVAVSFVPGGLFLAFGGRL